MSHDHDDPRHTARALGESPDAGMELDGSERARIERTAALACEVLRATDVAGLDATMRSQIAARAAQRSRSRTWPRALAVTLGGGLMVALALYLGVVRPAEQRALLAERALAERARAEFEKQARAALEERERRLALERAQAKYAAEQAALLSAQQAASMNASGAKAAVPTRSAARGGSVAKPREAGSAGSSAGGCDANDPLCGL